MRRHPKASVYLASSLDGFIARADGSIDWLSKVERPGQDYGYQAFFAAVDTLVLGRRTYEQVLGFGTWPYGGKRCVVLSSDASRPSLHGEEFHSGDLSDLFDRLASQGAAHLYVDGGTVVAQALRQNLVTELTLSIVPILLGAGTPIAAHLGRDVALELVEHRAFESGLVQLRYRVPG